jgi:hypothetical protein
MLSQELINFQAPTATKMFICGPPPKPYQKPLYLPTYVCTYQHIALSPASLSVALQAAMIEIEEIEEIEEIVLV